MLRAAVLEGLEFLFGVDCYLSRPLGSFEIPAVQRLADFLGDGTEGAVDQVAIGQRQRGEELVVGRLPVSIGVDGDLGRIEAQRPGIGRPGGRRGQTRSGGFRRPVRWFQSPLARVLSHRASRPRR